MNGPSIIAFGHRRGVGKDLAGRLLLGHLRYQFPKLKIQKRSFAEHLKNTCHNLWGWAGLQEACYYDANREAKEIILPKIGKSPRDIWIEVGNKMRDVHSTVWVDYILNQNNYDILIITDLRYPNEMKLIYDRGGVCIRLDRPSIPKHDDIADSALAGCSSWSQIILNESLQTFSFELKKLSKFWE